MNNLFLTFKILSILIASTAIFANESVTLTKVERSTCILFPKIIEFEKQLVGVHYSITRDKYSGCEESAGGNIDYNTCADFITTKFKYVYKKIRKYDYYNSIGELITSTVENNVMILDRRPFNRTVGEWKTSTGINVEPVDDESKDLILKQFNTVKPSILIEINKLIFERDYTPCTESYYK